MIYNNDRQQREAEIIKEVNNNSFKHHQSLVFLSHHTLIILVRYSAVFSNIKGLPFCEVS